MNCQNRQLSVSAQIMFNFARGVPCAKITISVFVPFAGKLYFVRSRNKCLHESFI